MLSKSVQVPLGWIVRAGGILIPVRGYPAGGRMGKLLVLARTHLRLRARVSRDGAQLGRRDKVARSDTYALPLAHSPRASRGRLCSSISFARFALSRQGRERRHALAAALACSLFADRLAPVGWPDGHAGLSLWHIRLVPRPRRRRLGLTGASRRAAWRARGFTPPTEPPRRRHGARLGRNFDRGTSQPAERRNGGTAAAGACAYKRNPNGGRAARLLQLRSAASLTIARPRAGRARGIAGRGEKKNPRKIIPRHEACRAFHHSAEHRDARPWCRDCQ
jgi:hypothetical protein